MKRIVLITAGVCVVLLAAVVVFLFTGLGAAIKAVVEGVGSRATQTEVTLGSADVSLSSGEGTLKKLVVGNPKGYGTPSAIELGEIHVQIDPASVTSDTIVVKEVLIDGPHLTYEVGGIGESNIGVIQDNVSKFSGGDEGGGRKGGGKGKGGGGGDSGGRKVIIEHLLVKGGRVDVSAKFLAGQKCGCDLGQIELRDIGKSSGGATAGEVAKEILGALTDSALNAVKGLDLDKLSKGMTDTLGGAVNNAIDGVGNILGGKKKNK